MSQLTKLWIDCDPGTDDFVALVAALRDPNFEVLGISAVAGNVPLEWTSSNVARILELLDHQAPYYVGEQAPLKGDQVTASDVHGETGLGDLVLPSPTRASETDTVAKALYEQALKSQGELVILALGPLTNLAKALACHPDLPRYIKRLVVMGGAYEGGNITENAEFNFYADPSAAKQVFEADWTVEVVGLDVTHALYLTAEELETHCAQTKLGRAVFTVSESIRAFDRSIGLGDIAHLHDYTAFMYLQDPSLFEVYPVEIRVIDEAGEELGRSLCDFEATHRKDLIVMAADQKRSRAHIYRFLQAL